MEERDIYGQRKITLCLVILVGVMRDANSDKNITLLCSRLNEVLDPDLEIRRGGGGGGSSRPLEKGGSPKKIFWSFGPQFGLKIRGRGPPGPLPWIHHCNDHCFVRYYSQAHKRTNKEIKTKRLER